VATEKPVWLNSRTKLREKITEYWVIVLTFSTPQKDNRGFGLT